MKRGTHVFCRVITNYSDYKMFTGEDCDTILSRTENCSGIQWCAPADPLSTWPRGRDGLRLGEEVVDGISGSGASGDGSSSPVLAATSALQIPVRECRRIYRRFGKHGRRPGPRAKQIDTHE